MSAGLRFFLHTFAVDMPKSISKFSVFLWRHKYVVTTLLFLLIIGVVDPHSLLYRYKLRERNASLREEISIYDSLYAHDLNRLKQIKGSADEAEAEARVNLFLKTPDEDVYVIENQGTDSMALKKRE